MIRINLAKASGGKKGGGGSAWGVARTLFLLMILALCGAYFYVAYVQKPKWWEELALADKLTKWIPDVEPLVAYVTELTGGVSEKLAAAASKAADAVPKKAAEPPAPDAATAKKPADATDSATAQKAAEPPPPDSAPARKLAAVEMPKPDTARDKKAAVEPPKPKASDPLEITYPSASKAAAETDKKAAAAKAEPAPEKAAAAAKPEPAAEKPAEAPPKKTAAPKPSSLVRSNMAEDVVKEFDNEAHAAAAASKISVTYAEMTVAEKINYEVSFGRNAFEMVTRCAPPGTKLKTLEIENFQTIYASGAGASREMVQEMFAAFRKERGELLPKPLSHIRDGDKGGYQFVITHKPLFGTEPNAPFQAIDYIEFKGGLQVSINKFSKMAGANGVKLTSAPVQASVEKAGQYRRFVYKASGVSTYQSFRKFVLALYGEKVTCAFKKVTMTPIKDEQVRVNMEILFTVKD
jgi:hypothetical protein